VLSSKRRIAIALLLFLQAVLFAFFALYTFMNVTPSDPTGGMRAGYMEYLAGPLVAGLGIFVWRGSRVALIVTMVLCAIEVVLAIPLALFAVIYGGLGIIVAIYVLPPLFPIALVALPTFILCVPLPRSRPPVPG
jgi:hypothetical protein